MDAASKTTLAIAIVVAAMLLVYFGSGMLSGTMASGGAMGSASSGGIGWMSLCALIAVAFGAALFWVICARK